MTRNEKIGLLENYSTFLAANGYMDEDWRSEPPYAIDEFLKLTEPESVPSCGEPKDIIQLERERMKWSIETFTEATPLSSLKKLRTEIDEIEYDIQNNERRPEEYADALMCLLDSAGRQGIFPEEIFEAFENKLQVNKSRQWKKNPDNSYSHTKH